MAIEIRSATAEDRELLVEMYLQLLKFLDQFENEILPTRKNAEYFVDAAFLPGIARGDPVLIAWDDDKPAGAIFWVVQYPPFEVRWTNAIGYGTYILESYRHKKVGTLLRKEGLRILKDKGIQKLVGMPHFKNEISMKSSEKLGWKPFMRYDLLDIQSS